MDRRCFLKAVAAAVVAPVLPAAPSGWIHADHLLETTTHYVKKEAFTLEFFCCQTVGYAVLDNRRAVMSDFD